MAPTIQTMASTIKPVLSKFWDPEPNIQQAIHYINDDEQDKMVTDFRKSALVHNISLLPRDMIGKLYIHAMRKFWRKYVPITAKIPTWYSRKIEVDRILWNARYQNIHFLHLPFNTLPENKQFIRGCRCYDCCMEYGNMLGGGEVVSQIVPLSPHSEGFIASDMDGREMILNYPGEKTNTHFQTRYYMFANILKNKRIKLDFSPATKALYSSHN